MAEIYSAKIDHNENTIEAMYKVRYYVYGKLRIVLRLLLGLALVMTAVFSHFPMWGKALLLLAGTWLIATKDLPAQAQADKALMQRGAVLPSMSYSFYDDHLRLSGEGSMDLPYEKLSRLVEEDKYLYLFVSQDSVCMLERSSVQPEDDKGLMAFLEEKTGLKWSREKNLLAMNIFDIKQLISDMRKK